MDSGPPILVPLGKSLAMDSEIKPRYGISKICKVFHCTVNFRDVTVLDTSQECDCTVSIT